MHQFALLVSMLSKIKQGNAFYEIMLAKLVEGLVPKTEVSAKTSKAVRQASRQFTRVIRVDPSL